MIDQTKVQASWRAGDFAKLHDVYFGESYEQVSAATRDDANVFVGRQVVTQLPMGMTGGPAPGGLVPGQTYYWRVDEINDAEPNSPWKGNIWSFRVRPLAAWDPFPVEAMRNIDPNQDLSWDIGMGAIFHTVFVGQSFDEVSTATTGGMMSANPSYEPGTLALDTTYYWRVDEFAFPPGITHKGPVWSFTTRGEGGGVKAEYFGGMALAGDPILSRIEPVIDHSWGAAEVAGGLLDLVSARWRGNLEVPFTEKFSLITTADDGVRLWFDGRLVIDNWVDQGATDRTFTVDLVAGQYYMIQMEYYENGGDAVARLSWQSDTLARQIIPQGWLQLPLRATSPSPAHLDPYANQTPILTWNGGDDATGHDVYFGEDANAVANADTTTAAIYRGRQAADATSFDPGSLEWGKTYYWRVDEVNPDGVLTGALWSFTTATFILVDDFESYTNYSPNRVFQTWIDGWGFSEDEFFPTGNPGNGTGAMIGYDPALGDIVETRIVHGGRQAMPFDYNNVNSPYYSETVRTWNAAQNWTVNGVNTLTVHVRGQASNGAAVLYVTLDDSTGKSATVSYGDDTLVKSGTWVAWSIPLSRFSGINPAKIKKMTIGVGKRAQPTPGGAGLIYIDDIRVVK
jgi:hypothetical protein